MSFADRFTGQGIQPADAAYRAVAFSIDQQLEFPSLATPDNVFASLMDVSPAGNGLALILPDAQEGSVGASTMMSNVGLYNFTVKDAAGNVVSTLSPGQQKFLYLRNTASLAGAWGISIIGATTGALDAATVAGNGLTVLASLLNVSFAVSTVSGSRVVTSNDRANVLLWNGGSGALTFPLSGTLAPFLIEVRNQGSGVLTLTPTGGELIDGSATVALNAGESCFVHAGAGAWYTVGRGRLSQFNFTQLQKSVSGGTVTLTLTEAANVVQTYTGVLTSNVDIVVPAVVQVYYVSNQTSGAFNLRVKNPGAGASVSIPTGQSAVLFSDGVNVINASTTVAGISSIVFAAGSAASPSVGIGASNTGLYSSGANEVGVSANGVQVARFDPSGLTLPLGGTLALSSASGPVAFALNRPAGQFGVTNYYTAATQRWRAGVDNAAEGGSNAGSDFAIARYNDAGALVDTPLKITRSSALVTLLAGLSVGTTLGVAGAATLAGDASVAGTLTLTKGIATALQSPAFSTTLAIDLSLGDTFFVGNATSNMSSLTLSNPVDGKPFMIRYRQDGTGGRTLAIPTGAKVAGSYSTTANQVSVLNLYWVNALTRYEGAWTVVPL